MSHIFKLNGHACGMLIIVRTKKPNEKKIKEVYIEHNFSGIWKKEKMQGIVHQKGDFEFRTIIEKNSRYQYIFQVFYENGDSIWVSDTDCSRFEKNKYGSLNTVVETFVNPPEVSGIFW